MTVFDAAPQHLLRSVRDEVSRVATQERKAVETATRLRHGWPALLTLVTAVCAVAMLIDPGGFGSPVWGNLFRVFPLWVWASVFAVATMVGVWAAITGERRALVLQSLVAALPFACLTGSAVYLRVDTGAISWVGILLTALPSMVVALMSWVMHDL